MWASDWMFKDLPTVKDDIITTFLTRLILNPLHTQTHLQAPHWNQTESTSSRKPA